MRLATWNVNSVRARADRILDWLQRSGTDVLAMQETKCKDEQFPYERFEELGYRVAHVGLSQWNGVAIASRIGLDDVQIGFEDQPGFTKDPDADPAQEARAIGATCGGVRVWSLYVPNGRELADPHYVYKLEWLAKLRADAQAWLAADPQTQIALVGDWNIAPTDEDVWDPAFFEGKTHTSEPEREAFRAFLDSGFTDVVRPHARPGGVHLLGLHPAPIPEASGHADRLRPRFPGARGACGRRGDRPQRAQGQGGERPRAGRRRPRGLRRPVPGPARRVSDDRRPARGAARRPDTRGGR